jgi:hypothetical protein
MHRWARRVGVALGVVLAVWLVMGALQLAYAVGDARTARSDLEAVRAASGARDLYDDPALSAAIDASKRRFDTSSDRARSLWVAPYRRLPVLGRQIEAFDALAAGSVSALEEIELTIDTLRSVRGGDLGDGSARLDAVRTVGDRTSDSATVVESIDAGPDEALVAPLAEARTDFVSERDELARSLRAAADVAVGLEAFLEGPSTYLLLAANNAQMQSGQGMFLSAGLLEVAEGSFSLTEMRSTAELPLPLERVELDADYVDRWAAVFDPHTDWRHLGMTPRFDVTARAAADLWEAATGDRVDGVLSVDPVALGALLDGTGPVEVDGEWFTGAEVVQELLVDQYERTVEGESFEGANADRRERLSAIAEAVVAALGQGVDPAALLDSMGDVLAGRHLLAWSPHEDQQRAWDAGGLSGRLDDHDVLLSLVNRGGNKLDPYIQVHATAAHDPIGGDVIVEVSIANTAPDGLPQYVEGPYDPSDTVAGEYLGVLALNVGPAAGTPTVDGVERYAVSGADGSSRVGGVWVRIQRGQTITRSFRFTVAPDVDGLRVVPSARVPPVGWSWPGGGSEDHRPFTLPLGELRGRDGS